MSSTLNPSYQTIAAIRTSIQNTLKTELPPDMQAGAIAPLLISVTQWANQIPAVLEGTGPSSSVNLIFAIRGDLFVAPRFIQNVFNIPTLDLPGPFADFISFIHKLIAAQKSDKDKPIAKVRLVRFALYIIFPVSTHPCLFSLISVLVVLPNRRLM
jgi:hypothetical protein